MGLVSVLQFLNLLWKITWLLNKQKCVCCGCSRQSDVERHTLAKYLMELTLLDYNMVHYRPSEVAAAALCLSQLLLEGLPWVSLTFTLCCNVSDCVCAAVNQLTGPVLLLSQSPTQQHYSTYDEAHLRPVMQHIAKNLVNVNEGRTKFLVSLPSDSIVDVSSHTDGDVNPVLLFRPSRTSTRAASWWRSASSLSSRRHLSRTWRLLYLRKPEADFDVLFCLSLDTSFALYF